MSSLEFKIKYVCARARVYMYVCTRTHKHTHIYTYNFFKKKPGACAIHVTLNYKRSLITHSASLNAYTTPTYKKKKKTITNFDNNLLLVTLNEMEMQLQLKIKIKIKLNRTQCLLEYLSSVSRIHIWPYGVTENPRLKTPCSSFFSFFSGHDFDKNCCSHALPAQIYPGN